MKFDPKPARKLPDPVVCRAKAGGFGGVVDCLVKLPHDCPYAIRFGYGVTCNHPERANIVAKTETGERQ